uniref:Uncharacterized protein n=1 Tax=Nothobranchius furzeri TaxID=105023 RepID=A0A8C6PNT5_NOTFU
MDKPSQDPAEPLDTPTDQPMNCYHGDPDTCRHFVRDCAHCLDLESLELSKVTFTVWRLRGEALRWVADNFDVESLKTMSFWEFASVLLHTFGPDPPLSAPILQSHPTSSQTIRSGFIFIPPVHVDAISAPQMSPPSTSQQQRVRVSSPDQRCWRGTVPPDATSSLLVGQVAKGAESSPHGLCSWSVDVPEISSSPSVSADVIPAPPRRRTRHKCHHHHQQSPEARAVPPIQGTLSPVQPTETLSPVQPAETLSPLQPAETLSPVQPVQEAPVQPVQEPPVQGSTPPVQGSTPPVQGLTPPVQKLTPPVQKSTPPVQKSTPPGQKSTPPGQKSKPPGQKSMPPGQKSMPPGQKSTPAVSKSTPPVSKSTPPVLKSTPPGQKSMPPVSK